MISADKLAEMFSKREEYFIGFFFFFIAVLLFLNSIDYIHSLCVLDNCAGNEKIGSIEIFIGFFATLVSLNSLVFSGGQVKKSHTPIVNSAYLLLYTVLLFILLFAVLVFIKTILRFLEGYDFTNCRHLFIIMIIPALIIYKICTIRSKTITDLYFFLKGNLHP